VRPRCLTRHSGLGSGVGRGEHEDPRRHALLGHAVMQVGGREQAEGRVMVLGVDQGKKTWQWARPLIRSPRILRRGLANSRVHAIHPPQPATTRR
jgi:hypothetical protein